MDARYRSVQRYSPRRQACSSIIIFEKIAKGDPDRAYKQMITWTKVEDKVYEISYSARYGLFMKYLSIVEEMIQSFQLTNIKKRSRIRRKYQTHNQNKLLLELMTLYLF